MTLPSGSPTFGSQGLGARISGIIQYDFNSEVSLGVMFGGSTMTMPSMFGGDRYFSLLPSLVLAYGLNDRTSVYAEAFGETKTNATDGGNYNLDYGLLYLLTQSVVLDIEFGHQLSNVQNSFNYFINTGITCKF